MPPTVWIPLTDIEIVLPVLWTGILAMSTLTLLVGQAGRMGPLPRAVLAVNIVGLVIAASESAVIIEGGMHRDFALSRQVLFVGELAILAASPTCFATCGAFLGEGEPATRRGRLLKAALRAATILTGVVVALGAAASILRPDLLVSLDAPAPNPEGLARLAGRGLPGPVRTLGNLLLAVAGAMLPVAALIAARAARLGREGLVFVSGAFFLAWFGEQPLFYNFTGHYYGIFRDAQFARGITGLGLFSVLSAVAAYRVHVREAAEAGSARAVAAREREERDRADRGRREAESRLAQVFAFLPDPTFAIDAEGRIIVWNNAVEELTGVRAGEILGKGDREYSLAFFGKRRPILIDLALSPAPETESAYHRFERSGDVVVATDYNLYVRGGKGVWLWGIAAPVRDEEGQVVGAVECIRDISDIRRTEDRLHELTSTLETRVVERTAELTLARDSLVRAEKNAVVGRLGATIAHELNTPLAAILSTAGTWRSDLPRALASFAAVAGSGDASRREALDRLVETIGSRAMDAGVTSSARYALRKELAEALACSPLADPGHAAEILADILPPDEARKALPLVSAPGSEALLDAIADVGVLLRGVAVVNESARKAARVVGAISAYSRKDEEVASPVDVVECLENILVLYYGSTKRGIEVERCWLSHDPVLAVRDSLDQVWVNLINNALHAMEGKGLLSLSTRTEGAEVVVTVTDSGPGIPPEIAPRLFEPFFTTKPPGEGTGIGLDTARRIVERYGGTIGFESRPGKTTFTVRLPAASARVDPPSTDGL